MYQLKLNTVGIGKIHGIVSFSVLRILARRIEDAATETFDVPRQRIDLRTTLCVESYLA